MAKEGILGKVAETRVAGIPIGAAATGALTAGLADAVLELVGGVIPSETIPENIRRTVFSGLGSFGIIKWGGKLVGDMAAQTGV